jgi:hypothetical protein
MKGFITGLGTGMIITAVIIAMVQISQPASKETDLTDRAEALETTMIIPQTQSEKVTETESETATETESAEVTETELQTVSIVITDGMKADDICRMLENEGVISDYDGFYDYIKNKNATQKLRSGEFVFSKNSSNEVVYNALIGE